MASPAILLRARPLLPLRVLQHHHHFLENNGGITHRLLCTATADSNLNPITSPSLSHLFSLPITPQDSISKWTETDSLEWQVKETEILSDIEHVFTLTKKILHSDRYMDGEFLSQQDEKVVVEKLLAHHPHCADKIGCGLSSIMVDRHPQFKNTRCLFVVRTDGHWIDFSYQKCLRSYIRGKYPFYAEKFLRKHLKRSS